MDTESWRWDAISFLPNHPRQNVWICITKKGLTLKRILKRHKKNPQDKELHRTIEEGSVGRGEFLGFITKATLPKKGKNK